MKQVCLLHGTLDIIYVNLKGNFCAGLGFNIDDICGRDWVSGGGDHGDPGNYYLCRHGFIWELSTMIINQATYMQI